MRRELKIIENVTIFKYFKLVESNAIIKILKNRHFFYSEEICQLLAVSPLAMVQVNFSISD